MIIIIGDAHPFIVHYLISVIMYGSGCTTLFCGSKLILFIHLSTATVRESVAHMLMDIEYVDILTGEKLSSILLANMGLLVSSFLLVVDGSIVILARCVFHFFKEHDNLV